MRSEEVFSLAARPLGTRGTLRTRTRQGEAQPAQAQGLHTAFTSAGNLRAEQAGGWGLAREYDWKGNNKKTTDDAGGFYDRSLGTIENGAPDDAAAGDDEKPYQLNGAAITDTSATSPGSLQARYDAAGYMTGMVLNREGACLAAGSSDPDACNQRFDYQWDEVGRLSRARRWDGTGGDDIDATPLPTEAPAADLRYSYDASDQRVTKQAVDEASNSSFTLYVFETLELRRAQWSDDAANGGGEDGTFDYEANHWTVVPYLLANGVRLARLAYDPDVAATGAESSGEPGHVSQSTAAGGDLHLLFELGDHLGSTSVVLDKATGELVERATFQAYGGAESDYRTDRWKNFREDYRFTGKEEDVEVGLQYFGKRYLNPLLGRWISADPLAVHAPGEADLNVYAYVHGEVLKNIDPLGLESEEAAAEVQELSQAYELGQVSDDVYRDKSQLEGSSWTRLNDKELEAHGLKREQFENTDSGFRAELYRNQKTGAYALAFRGTDDWRDVVEDVSQGLGLYEEQYLQAVKLGEAVAESVGTTNVVMTGHSLGGGLAAAAALRTSTRAVTFNAAGLQADTIRFALRSREPRPMLARAEAGRADEMRLNMKYGSNILAYSSTGDPLTRGQEAADVLPDAVGAKRQFEGKVSHSVQPLLDAMVKRMDKLNGAPDE